MTECALNAKPNEQGSCLSKDGIAEVVKHASGNTLEEVKKNTNCDTDLCILEAIDLPVNLKEKIKRESLKAPTASFDHNHWLNNTEVDSIMSQFRINYPGFAHGFIHMIDLKSYEPGNVKSFDYNVESVSKTDLPKEFKTGLIERRIIPECECNDHESILSTYKNVPLSSYGIICNTDDSSGSGQHWFCIFISTDQKDPDDVSVPMIQIELFNSGGGGSGNTDFDCFWVKQASKIARETGLKCIFKIVTTLKHQRPDTGNCGSYSLFYIYSRLRGVHPSHFNNPKKIISDHEMREFRKVCFTIDEDTSAFTLK